MGYTTGENSDGASPTATMPPPPPPPVYPTNAVGAPEPRKGPRTGRGGGVQLGVLLIVIGLAFLLAQFVPGVRWWSLWPLVIVLGGLIQMVTPDRSEKQSWIERVFDGIGTLIFGLILLGNTTGHVSWAVWWVVLSLWPILLIAGGIAILGKALKQTWIRLLAPLVIWAALGYAVALTVAGGSGFVPLSPMVIANPAGDQFALSEPLGTTKSADFSFQGGAGDIRFGSTSGADLVSANGTSQYGEPALTVGHSGDTATVDFKLTERDGAVVVPGVNGARADVNLSEVPLWDTAIDAGAASLTGDFTRLKLRSLTLKTGVSSIDLNLGDVPLEVASTPVVVKAGVSSVTLNLPTNAEARVHASTGLSSVDVDKRFSVRSEGNWKTPGYDSAAHRYDIDVESGVGSVEIR